MNNAKCFTPLSKLSFVAVLLFLFPGTALAQGGMLYMVKFEASEAGAPTTREQAIELLDTLIVPSLEGLANNNKIQAGGLLVGARAGVFIVKANSHDDVTEMVRGLPAWGVWSWNVMPRETFAHRAALEKRVVQGLRTKK